MEAQSNLLGWSTFIPMYCWAAGEELEQHFSKCPALFIKGSKTLSFTVFSHFQTVVRDRQELMLVFPPPLLSPSSQNQSKGEIADATAPKGGSAHQEIKTKPMISVTN